MTKKEKFSSLKMLKSYRKSQDMTKNEPMIPKLLVKQELEN